MKEGVKHSNSSTQIRDRILASKRLNITNGRISNKLPIDSTGCKNSLMLYVEDKFRLPIEELIWQDVAEKVAEKLEISVRTIYRWRKKYPLNEFKYGKNNRKLPISINDGNS